MVLEYVSAILYLEPRKWRDLPMADAFMEFLLRFRSKARVRRGVMGGFEFSFVRYKGREGGEGCWGQDVFVRLGFWLWELELIEVLL